MFSPEPLCQNLAEYLGVDMKTGHVDYTVIKSEKEEGYERYLISYAGSEGDEIRAFFFIPCSSGTFPGLLVHHQHGGERHIGKSEVAGLIGHEWQAFGPELARRGFIVLAPDSICFEDRRVNKKGIEADGYNDFLQHYNEMCYRLVQGELLMKKVLEDASIAVSLLQQHRYVQSNRIGVLGHSYGGNTVLFQAALDERIQFACSSGAACSYAEKMRRGTGIEMAEVIPGLVKKFDIEDLIKCIAPRKILIMSAEEDKYSQDAHIIVERAREAFIKNSAADNLQHKRFRGGHALNQARFTYITNWLVEQA